MTLAQDRRNILKQLDLPLQMSWFYSMDLLFKYGKYQIACDLLFYRNKAKDLLNLIRLEYEVQD